MADNKKLTAAGVVAVTAAVALSVVVGAIQKPTPAGDCACRSAEGDCNVVTDAGLVAAPFGKTLGPGYPPNEVFKGSGCIPKPCVAMAGQHTWPEGCPRKGRR